MMFNYRHGALGFALVCILVTALLFFTERSETFAWSGTLRGSATLPEEPENDLGNETKRERHPPNAEEIKTVASVYPDHRPPLKTLIDIKSKNKTIIGDVSWLLSFAIIGSPKCGTSSLMRWLARHESEIAMYREEIRSLKNGMPGEMVELMYALPEGPQYKRGYKAPNDLRIPSALNALHTYFPTTKLIIGIRHPISWFNSWYNFNEFEGNHGHKHTNDAMVRGILPPQLTFHISLSQLGKTQRVAEEMKLLQIGWNDKVPSVDWPRMENEVLLYDVSQPFDLNETRNAQFREDMQTYLDLKKPLKHINIRTKPAKKHNKYKFDLCKSDYVDTRSEIMNISRAAATWMRNYFIDLPEVKISQRSQFEEILDSWMTDPCDDEEHRYWYTALWDEEEAQANAVEDEFEGFGQLSSLDVEDDEVLGAPDKTADTDSDDGYSFGEVGLPNLPKVEVMKQHTRPPLADLVDFTTQTVKAGADLQFLAEFGIVGHAKTATSTLMRWINHHSEVMMPDREIHGLTFGHIADFADSLYKLPSDRPYKYGWKAPNDISSPRPRELIRQYLPKTKLIIGLRHPVKFMESFYNFNQRQGRTLPAAETLVGDRIPAQVLYHAHLAAMGKTNLTDPIESELVRPYLPLSETQLFLLGISGSTDVHDSHLLDLKDPRYVPMRMDNPVFLYDVSQPFDSDSSRNEAFRKDLSTFLELTTPLEQLVPYSSSKNNHYQIDICEGKFVELRKELVEIGRAASTWLLDFFLDLPDVTYSSPGHFKELLLTWRFDPCDDAASVTESESHFNEEGVADEGNR